MSSAARAVASRSTSVGFARTQPIRSPAQNALLIEPIVMTVRRRARTRRRARRLPPSRFSPAITSSTISGVRGGPRERDQPPALGRRQKASWVVVVRDEVGQSRADWRASPRASRGPSRPDAAAPEPAARRRHESRRAQWGRSGARRGRGRRGSCTRSSRSACRAPAVMRIWSGVVGAPRAVRCAAIASRRTGEAGGVVAGARQTTRELGGRGREGAVEEALGRRAGRAAEVDHVGARRAGRRRGAGVRGQSRP